MKIWSEDIVPEHKYLTNGKKYEVTDIVETDHSEVRGFWFYGDKGTISYAAEFGSTHLIAGGKWIIEEDK